MRSAVIGEIPPRAHGAIHVADVIVLARRRGSLRVLLRAVAVLAAIASGALGGRLTMQYVNRQLFATTPPLVSGIDVYALYVDDTPVPLTISAGWEKLSSIATRDAIRTDATLWRKMRIEDWDSVPLPLRIEALDTMLTRYRNLLADPRAWDHMNARDWDSVPQPIRALAFRHMAEYWTGYYQVGTEYGIPHRRMSDTLSALLMTESWFEHRSITTNRWGNRDIGLAQAADSSRKRMATLYRMGVVDVAFTEDDYLDPWKATRFAALWTALLLDDMDGDLAGAIRAYHRGTARARDNEGAEYLETVNRRLRRFIRNEGSDPSWSYLWRRDRALISEAWPWLSASAGALRNRPGADGPTPSAAELVPTTGWR